MKKLRSWLKLLSAPNVGHVTAARIIKLIGDPHEFLQNSKDKIKEIDFIGDVSKRYLLNSEDPPQWRKTSQLMDSLKISYTTILDSDYPTLLKNIYDPPLILFYRGSLTPGKLFRNFAVVGTRRPSNYGKLMADRISEQIAENGFLIVSGLANGIDSIAHKAALKKGKPTVAVMGTAIDNIYPAVNRDLAEDILENGCLISENQPGMKTEKWTFPARNRIISGLCSGVFVVEGNVKSGAMLTAKFALQQNREIFALPGDVNRDNAKGPNRLIKLGAKIVTEAVDILEEYDVQMDISNFIIPDLTPSEETIYNLLLDNKPDMLLDKVLIESKLKISQLSPILLTLELKSLIKKIPGNKIMPIY